MAGSRTPKMQNLHSNQSVFWHVLDLQGSESEEKYTNTDLPKKKKRRRRNNQHEEVEEGDDEDDGDLDQHDEIHNNSNNNNNNNNDDDNNINNELEKMIVRWTEVVETKQEETKNQIIAAISQQPAELKTMILENFVVEGVTPLSARDIENMLNAREKRLVTRINQHIDASRSSSSVTTNVRREENVDTRVPVEFTTFHWGGRIRMVPEDFTFPLFDAKTMFILWYFGNAELKIQPYKHLQSHRDDLRLKNHKTNFDRARLVMTELENIFSEHKLLGDNSDITELNSMTEQNNAFDHAYEKLIERCYNGQQTPHKRPNDITLNTLADRLYKNKRQRTAAPDSEPEAEH